MNKLQQKNNDPFCWSADGWLAAWLAGWLPRETVSTNLKKQSKDYPRTLKRLPLIYSLGTSPPSLGRLLASPSRLNIRNILNILNFVEDGPREMISTDFQKHTLRPLPPTWGVSQPLPNILNMLNILNIPNIRNILDFLRPAPLNDFHLFQRTQPGDLSPQLRELPSLPRYLKHSKKSRCSKCLQFPGRRAAGDNFH